MAEADRQSDTQQEALTQTTVSADRLYPNPWNVNQMDDFMFRKEVESIRTYGFVDPLLVRPHPYENAAWQIIDGEHRWRGGLELGMTEFPVNIIDVDDETAQELSIVLNETRGSADAGRLSSLVRSLAEKKGAEHIARVMPFTNERFAEMVAKREELDFSKLQERSEILQKTRPLGAWVERVYRLPRDSAEVVDESLQKIMEAEGIDDDWKALELMAADSLAGN